MNIETMTAIESILPHSMAIDPAATAEQAFATVPGKWGVVLLCDDDAKPLQLICTRNMRAMLRRRFDPAADLAGPTKRIDYRQIVRSIRWQRVDSELEMDLAYIEAARVCFPIHWRQLIPDRRAFFVQIDPQQPFPEFVRFTDPLGDGIVFGPFVDKTKAERWVDQIRDAFDLCRYHHVLAQAPNGKACTYKQMGKCPAPCDGTVPMSVYHDNIRRAIDAATNADAGIAMLTRQMSQQAAALEFEAAGKTKSRIDLLKSLAGGSFRSVKPLGVFDYLSVQPGPKKGTAKLFRVTASAVMQVASVIDEGFSFDAIPPLLSRAIVRSDLPPAVLLGAVCHYLGGSKTAARFLPIDGLDESSLRKAIRAAMKVETPETDAETIRETALPG